MTHSRTHNTHEKDTYTHHIHGKTTKIRLDAMLSQQIQAEEQKFLAKYIR